MYGNSGKVKISRGKIHDYLGMTLDFSTNVSVCIDMENYVKDMVQNFYTNDINNGLQKRFHCIW